MWQILALLALGLSAAFVHFRGHERHRFLRQLTDHSTFMAPVNCLLYLFSAVPNEPLLDVHCFRELRALRDDWKVLRDDALRLYEAGHVKASAEHDDPGFQVLFKRGWKRFYLKWYGDALPSARALCPRSVALLERVPSVQGAMFALLPAGARLGAHRDPYAGSLRYHLGLVTPNDDACRILVDGEPYSWRDGEDFLFDETYVHEAHNGTDRDRLILFADVERPMRHRAATALNRVLRRVVLRATRTKNLPGDEVGALSRAFGGVYRLHLAGQALKERDRRLYYTLKYATLVGLLALFLAL